MIFAILHALAVASLYLIGGTLVLIGGAHVWAWLTKKDPAEFWMSKQYETEEVQQHAPYRNQDVTFADYEWEERAFALDHEPRPAA